MYIGLGENLGADYRLVGTDGRTLSGGGEGGSIFRCRPDGSDLTLWATGFWNPHASCVDAFGQMFTVDNDPDDRPPCRMLHIIPGGDYGYRFRNGRRGIHPFTAWDGELPGTLQMVSRHGRGPVRNPRLRSRTPSPTNIAVHCSSPPGAITGSTASASPARELLSTSKAEPLIVGGENFRPVGLALGPGRQFFATDWVLKDYNVHGNGRIWRIAPKENSKKSVDDLAALHDVRQKLDSPRMDVRRRAAELLSHAEPSAASEFNQELSLRRRCEAAWASCRASREVRVGRPRGTPLRSSLKNAEMRELWPHFELGNANKDEVLLSRLKQPWPINPSCVLVDLVSRHPPLSAADSAWLAGILSRGDRFVFAAVTQGLTDGWGYTPQEAAKRIHLDQTPSPQVRLALLLAARQSSGSGWADAVLPVAFADPDPQVRFTAIQWVGEARLAQFRGEIERELENSKTTADLFDASLASLEMLDGVKRKPGNEFSGADYALRLACDAKVADNVRAMALRIVPLDHKKLSFGQLTSLMKDGGPQLRFEALRTFRNLPFPQGPKIERELSLDEHADKALRLEAIAGLAVALERDEQDAATIAALRHLLTGPDPQFAAEALRAASLGSQRRRRQ